MQEGNEVPRDITPSVGPLLGLGDLDPSDDWQTQCLPPAWSTMPPAWTLHL